MAALIEQFGPDHGFLAAHAPDLFARPGAWAEGLAAWNAGRDKLRQGMLAANADPVCRLKSVLIGDPALDPELAPDHPVRGRAWHERQLAEIADGKKTERLRELKARKADVTGKPPATVIKISPPRTHPPSPKRTERCKEEKIAGPPPKPPAAKPSTTAAAPRTLSGWKSISKRP